MIGNLVYFGAFPYRIRSIDRGVLHLVGDEGRECWVDEEHILLMEVTGNG